MARKSPTKRHDVFPATKFLNPTIVTITPAQARRLLQRNTRNRPLRRSRVATLVSSLHAKQWHFNGDPIMISTEDVVVNGQHRLTACVEANVPIKVILITGVDPSTYEYVDTHAPRTYADALHIQGYSNSHQHAAVIRVAYLYEHCPADNRVDAKSVLITPHLLTEYLASYPQCVEFLTTPHCSKIRSARADVSDAALLWYAFERSGYVNKREEFFGVMEGTVPAVAAHPARALLGKRAQMKAMRQSGRPADRITLCVRTFNAYIEGRLLTKMYNDPNAPVPSFKGWPRGLLA